MWRIKSQPGMKQNLDMFLKSAIHFMKAQVPPFETFPLFITDETGINQIFSGYALQPDSIFYNMRVEHFQVGYSTNCNQVFNQEGILWEI